MDGAKRFEEASKICPTFRCKGYDDPSPSTEPLPEFAPVLPIQVLYKGTREWVEAKEESNRKMLENAKSLEEEDEDGCATEEDKIAFRAFKAKFAAVYRSFATEPVLKYNPPSDTL